MVDEPGAISIPTNNYFADRNGYSPKWIICHGTAGFSSAQDVGVYFQTADVSANYVVGQDGTIVQCVAEKDGAWGNGVLSAGHDSWWTEGINPNDVTISIEHVKPHTDNSDILTDAQKASSFRLIDHICQRRGIPRQMANANGGITGHFSIDPVNRSQCPGPYPWDELIAYLNGNSQGDDMSIDINSPGVKNYFTETDSSHWQCTNGNVVAFGLLGFYKRSNGLLMYGLPLSGELYPKPNTAVQIFERGIIAYDPGKTLDNPPGSADCYPMHINQGAGFDALTKPLADKIAALTQQLASTQNANVQQLQSQIQTLTAQLSTTKSALAQIATEATAAAK